MTRRGRRRPHDSIPIEEVKMRAQGMVIAVVTALLVPGVTAAQWLNQRSPGTPRLPDGKPDLSAPVARTADGHADLSGIWNAGTLDYYMDLTSGLNPGEVQLTAWAAGVRKQRMDRDHVDDPYAFCLPLGVPRINFRSEMKIVQTPPLTLFLYETYAGMTFRQVFTDGRPLPPAAESLPTWLGYSVGHWDGDAFVVETTGLRDGGWLSTREAYPHSDALRVTERFRRKDFGHMDIVVTIDDPKAYAKPWTNTVPMTLRPDTELLEAFCDNQLAIVQHFRNDPPPPEPPSPRN
jgi:hypothetical protein